MDEDEALKLVIEAARYAECQKADDVTPQLPLFIEASADELDEAIRTVNTEL